MRIHRDDDPVVGKPLCPECFDYPAAVVWNAHAPELWRRTTIAIRRRLDRLAAAHGVSVRVSYAKVAEFQTRGLVHFHALIRLDGIHPDDPDQIVPPPWCMTSAILEDTIRDAVTATVFATTPHPLNPDGWVIRWGSHREDVVAVPRPLDIRTVREAVTGEVTDQTVVSYLVKYATKSTEAVGATPHRITGDTIDLHANTHTHLGRLIGACWRYGQVPNGPEYEGFRALRRWAHMLGFRGHFSTTLKAIRGERVVCQRRRVLTTLGLCERDPDSTLVVGMLSYAGSGWHTTGDALLALSAAVRARERRRIAREEHACTPAT